MKQEKAVVKNPITTRAKLSSMFETFFAYEASGGILLFLAAAAAMIVANFGWEEAYHHWQHLPIMLQFGESHIEKGLLHWVNDGAMVIFFLLIGLEIKREFVEGELSTRDQAVLPIVAAFFGVAAPSAIYIFFNLDNPEALRGWAIPAATDIAFAIGIIALFGKSIPVALRVLLVAIAVIDDLIAIVIIAVFYTSDLNFEALMLAGLCLLLLLTLNLAHISRLVFYVPIGLLLWVFVLNSGIHATLAGVLLALFIPLEANREARERDIASPAHRVEKAIIVPVNFLILPVFGFLNAGVNIASPAADASEPWYTAGVFLGIVCGLFFGKVIGIFSALLLMVKTGLSRMPAQCSWPMLYAMAHLCGIGFTMSLFIGGLSFGEGLESSTMRIGVLVGSTVSCIAGAAILFSVKSGKKLATSRNKAA